MIVLVPLHGQVNALMPCAWGDPACRQADISPSRRRCQQLPSQRHVLQASHRLSPLVLVLLPLLPPL